VKYEEKRQKYTKVKKVGELREKETQNKCKKK
jgi:hypothetical protein